MRSVALAPSWLPVRAALVRVRACTGVHECVDSGPRGRAGQEDKNREAVPCPSNPRAAQLEATSIIYCDSRPLPALRF